LPWGSSPSRKNPHGRTGNRTRDLMISSRKLWPLDHEAGHIPQVACKKNNNNMDYMHIRWIVSDIFKRFSKDRRYMTNWN
jgi:hypothetical protein